MNQILTKCPVCGSDTEVTRIYCPHCDTTIEGHFHATANPFAGLARSRHNLCLLLSAVKAVSTAWKRN